MTPETPLTGDFDPYVEAAKLPSTYLVKGMFFNRIGGLLEGDFKPLLPRLSCPPRLGRYVPFGDYPQSDYAILAAEAARRLFGDLPLQEGVRRISRNDFGVFASSTLGRIVLSSVGDLRTALLQVPRVYSTLALGEWRITAEELGANVVRIEFNPHPGVWAYQLGQLEGILNAFESEGPIRFQDLGAGHVRFDVHLPLAG